MGQTPEQVWFSRLCHLNPRRLCTGQVVGNGQRLLDREAKPSGLFPTAGPGPRRVSGRVSSPPRALVLEGSLDTALHSPRSERDALKNWCDAADIALAFKTVHRIEDFDQIVEALGRDQPPFVHIICHGDHDDDDRPYLLFAPKPKKRNRIYLDAPETHTAFRRCFEGQSVLFSACLVAKYDRHIDRFRKSARLRYVAAFSRTVYDDEAILFDISLYHSILIAGLTFRAALERARSALEALGIRGEVGRGQRLVKVFG